jgi:hypothetical protein
MYKSIYCHFESSILNRAKHNWLGWVFVIHNTILLTFMNTEGTLFEGSHVEAFVCVPIMRIRDSVVREGKDILLYTQHLLWQLPNQRHSNSTLTATPVRASQLLCPFNLFCIPIIGCMFCLLWLFGFCLFGFCLCNQVYIHKCAYDIPYLHYWK